MKPLLLFSVLTLLSVAPAAAQELRRWDVAGDVGWLSSNKSDIAPAWDDWYDKPTVGASIGRYWSPHLRGELRAAFGGEARIYEEQRVVVPGEPFPIFRLREHYFRSQTLAAAVHYQFFENQWFHPYLGAGLEVERESGRQLTPSWQGPIRQPGAPPIVLPEVVTETRINWKARPVVSGGFKWYVNERGFVRSDVRVSFDSDDLARATWTAGFGVDL